MDMKEIREKMNKAKKLHLDDSLISYFSEIERVQWVIMNMKLDGESMDLDEVGRVAKGEYLLNISLEQHVMVNRLTTMITFMKTLADLQEELNLDTINKFFNLISGGEIPEYRKVTPVLFTLSYNPVLPQEIEEELKRVIRELHAGKERNTVEKAIFIHNQIIRIYPFNEYNEIIARCAMEYILISGGLPVCPLELSEQEYNEILTKMLKGCEEAPLVWGDSDIFCDNLKKSINRRIELYLNGERKK